jgi:hypothetical protein
MKRFATAIAISSLLFMSAMTSAAEVKWDDGEYMDSTWSASNNWNPNSVPGDADTAVIDSTYVTTWPTLDVDDTVANCLFADGADMTVSSGSVLTVSSTLTIEDDATSGGGSSTTSISGSSTSDGIGAGTIQLNGGGDGVILSVSNCKVTTGSL